jgi:hypothetical protein
LVPVQDLAIPFPKGGKPKSVPTLTQSEAGNPFVRPIAGGLRIDSGGWGSEHLGEFPIEVTERRGFVIDPEIERFRVRVFEEVGEGSRTVIPMDAVGPHRGSLRAAGPARSNQIQHPGPPGPVDPSESENHAWDGGTPDSTFPLHDRGSPESIGVTGRILIHPSSPRRTVHGGGRDEEESIGPRRLRGLQEIQEATGPVDIGRPIGVLRSLVRCGGVHHSIHRRDSTRKGIVDEVESNGKDLGRQEIHPPSQTPNRMPAADQRQPQRRSHVPASRNQDLHLNLSLQAEPSR